MRICFMLSCFLLGTTFNLGAQGYTTAIGVRIGDGGGLTLVQRFAKKASVEFIAESDWGSDAFTVSAIARQHVPLISKRLNLYLGGGVHQGFQYQEEEVRGNPFGLIGQAGVEVSIKRTTVAFDFMPQVNVSGNVFPFALRKGLSVRYALVPRKQAVKFPWESNEMQKERLKKKKQRQRERKRNDEPWVNRLKFWERLKKEG